jgi:hypothetical protein
MATATGQFIDIPVIIRSLSRDFYRSAARHNYTIPLDARFLQALDNGVAAAAFAVTVDKFECEWWHLNPYALEIDPTLFLNVKNLHKCLEFHRQQLRLSPPSSGSSNHTRSKPCYIWKPDAGSPISSTDSCKRCRLYRAVALGTLDEHRDIRNQIQGVNTMLSTQKQLSIRRASGLNQLFEYLVIKEQAAVEIPPTDDFPVSAPSLGQPETLPPIQSSKSKKGKKKARGRDSAADETKAGRRDRAAFVRQQSIAEVHRLQNLPPLKWTWGVNMDASDLKHLRRAADTGHKLPHSGYDTSLLFGPETRTESTGVHSVKSKGYYSDVSDNAQQPPVDLDPEDIPSYFTHKFTREPGKYLQSLYDDSDIPIDTIITEARPAVPLTAPFVPPPPSPVQIRKLLFFTT